MKRFFWILLVIAAVAQPLSKSGIYMLFQANRGYIATHLCEKRHEPKSECQGKCYLQKKLKKDGEKQRQTPQAQKHVTENTVPAVAGIKIAWPFYELVLDKVPVWYQAKTYQTLIYRIFHPPKAMA